MTDPEDRSKKGAEDTPDDLELVEDDDIIAAEVDDPVEDMSTGKLDIPAHIRRKMEQAFPDGQDLPGEDPFEDDTDTGKMEVSPERAQALLDDREVFEEEELEEEETGDLGPPGEKAEEPVGDTMEEPVSPRRRRRRRRDEEQEEAEPVAAEPAAAPWNQDEAAADPEPMYQEDTDHSWTPETAEGAARSLSAAPTSVEPAGADPAQEKTLIFGEAAEPGPSEFPFLVVIQGEEEGREIELTQGQVTMGRGADNDLVFPDIACSRRHCLLEERGGDYVVTDLGSGNGTVVNGRRVQNSVLRDGDEIEIGSTILQFNLPSAAKGPRVAGTQTVTSTHPMSAEGQRGFMAELLADPRRKKLVVYGGGGVLGFLFLMLLVKAVSGPAEPPPPSPEEIQRQEQLRMQQELDEHMQEARRLVKEKDWKQAQLSIQLALKLDAQNRVALDYRDFVAREVGAQTALQTARSFIEQKAWDEAIAAINQVSNESEYYAEAAGLKKNIEIEIKSDLIAQGKTLMEEKNYNQALLKFDEVLRRDPGFEEAVELKRAAEEQIAKEEKRVARLDQKKKHKTVAFKKKKKGEAQKKGSLTGRLLALYKNGEIDKAIEKAEESGANETLVKLKKFKSVYTRGMDLSKNKGQVGKSIEFLKQAVSLDKKIAGGAGKYNQEIREKLGKNYFVKGVDAHMNKRYPEAYKAFKTSLKYHPGYELASKRLQDLEKIAKKFYEEAYIIKSTNADAAVNKLNTVLQIVPADHVYYTKAKRLKSSIQGPLSSEPTDESGF